MAPVNSDPFHDPIENKAGTYPIFCSFFFQVGLTIPFDPLLVDFLLHTRFHLGQLTPAVVRGILGVAELNMRFNVSLYFDDIRYCCGVSRNKGDGRWAIKVRVNSPSLVEALGDSHKYNYSDVVIIKGNVEPDPANNLVPRHFGAPGGLLVM